MFHTRVFYIVTGKVKISYKMKDISRKSRKGMLIRQIEENFTQRPQRKFFED